MKTPMKKLMLAAVAATLLCLGARADTANTVKVTKFHQSYPYSGKATVEYTVDGTLPANAVAEITIATDDRSATFTQKGVVTGANTNVIDFASSFGGALQLTNATFEVTIANGHGGVQLWKNGPYWAECNVGATTPEEYGYYFWWGDTVGYTNTVSGWVSVNDGTSFSFGSGTAGTTSGKDNSTLFSEGYIDSTGNLVAAHDAATVHLGAPWRMPTDAEFSAFLSNCTITSITTNGVSGRLFTGKGDFSDRSIFLPVAGYSTNSGISDLGTSGNYWSSTPDRRDTGRARHIFFLGYSPNYNIQNSYFRSSGMTVRSVREFAQYGTAVGSVTYDLPVTQTTPVPVPHTWIDDYPALLAAQSGDYEAAANATTANGRPVWACYVVGVDPSDPLDDFRITAFWMEGDVPKFKFNHTTDGSGNSFLPYVKPLGKAKPTDGWRHVPDGGNPAFRFFAVEVVPPGCESIVVELGGVQLWENGPYWAECNVGATKPEEYGYYFWWGDTVGYTCSGGTLSSNFIHPCIYSGVTWVSSTGEQMSSSPFTTSCPTYEKEDAELLSAGYIDSTTNLVAAHDAATAHLGAPWRMPTSAEIEALFSNCTTTWITTNGVNGRLVTGKGDYANRSIFLPAAGYGSGSYLYDPGSYGDFWASTPISDFSYNAWRLYFSSSTFRPGDYSRYLGQSVRPVRDAQ